jgi:hypothetical protein
MATPTALAAAPTAPTGAAPPSGTAYALNGSSDEVFRLDAQVRAARDVDLDVSARPAVGAIPSTLAGRTGAACLSGSGKK